MGSPFPDHIFSAGYGVHSRKESLTLYAGKMSLHDGTVIQPNIDLELTKARHFVLVISIPSFSKYKY